jgi:hypothetical protein
MDPDLLNPGPDSKPDPAFQMNPDPYPDLIQVQGFDDKKLKKINADLIFLKLQFTYVQETGEAFSSQKRTFSTSKNEI